MVIKLPRLNRSLPVRQQVYQLATVSHLAPRTIAQRLGVPLRTVQALLRRCRLPLAPLRPVGSSGRYSGGTSI